MFSYPHLHDPYTTYLQRFDPRPETGVYVLSGVDGSQEFVPTIPTPVELGVMLRYVFRQASLDSGEYAYIYVCICVHTFLSIYLSIFPIYPSTLA